MVDVMPVFIAYQLGSETASGDSRRGGNMGRS